MVSQTTIWLMVAGIVVLSLLDIGLNIISFIPYVGDVFETTSETVLEGIQILFTVIIGSIAVRRIK